MTAISHPGDALSRGALGGRRRRRDGDRARPLRSSSRRSPSSDAGCGGEEAGTAASVLGATNFGVAGLVSPIVGVIGTGSAAPMGLVMGVALTLATLVLWLVVRPRTVRPIED